MAKFRSFNYSTGANIYFNNGKYYLDKSCKKETKLTEYEFANFWKNAKKYLTGTDLYNLIKPHLSIYFHGETNSDESSIDNLEVVGDLLNELLIDLDNLSQIVTGRNEYSAIKLQERLKPILENIQEYSDEWRKNGKV